LTRHKFKAQPAMRGDRRFDSQLEAKYFDYLTSLQLGGSVVFFLRQVPFHLPGRTRYVVDFQVFWADGRVEFIDVKGMETELFKVKKRQVEEIYPVDIILAKKGTF